MISFSHAKWKLDAKHKFNTKSKKFSMGRKLQLIAKAINTYKYV